MDINHMHLLIPSHAGGLSKSDIQKLTEGAIAKIRPWTILKIPRTEFAVCNY
jgi:hypothetical protein